jgi:hypothetical protein
MNHEAWHYNGAQIQVVGLVSGRQHHAAGGNPAPTNPLTKAQRLRPSMTLDHVKPSRPVLKRVTAWCGLVNTPVGAERQRVSVKGPLQPFRFTRNSAL